MEVQLFLSLLAVAAIEAILSLTWSNPYFRFGIPIFSQPFRAENASSAPPEADTIQRQLPKGPHSALLFRDLGADTYAFREGPFSWGKISYTAIMRGLVRFDLERGQGSVVGYLNWFSLAFIVVVSAILISWTPTNPVALIFIFPMIGIVGWIYFIQRRRFLEVAETVSALWNKL